MCFIQFNENCSPAHLISFMAFIIYLFEYVFDLQSQKLSAVVPPPCSLRDSVR